MHSPDTLDFEALLRPIEGDKPAGEDIRDDPSPLSLYYQVKDARAAARAAERSGAMFEGGQQLVSDDWRTVLKLAPEILATKAKDIEIVAWLIEALVREHGFTGLRDGYRLARELVEQFWDGMYPTPDEDGVSTKVAPFSGLNGGESEGTLSVPIALAPITGDSEHGAFGLWRYNKVRDLAKSDDGGQSDTSGAGTLEQFEATVRTTEHDFFRRLIGDVELTIEHFAALTAKLDEHCGHDSPSSSQLRNTLDEAKQMISFVINDVAGIMIDTGLEDSSGDADGNADGNAAGEASSESAASNTSAGAAPAAASGAINNRDDAFRVLSRVADYFRDEEPHSPLSSLLYQAVRWGRLPLNKLIEELIPDSSARDHFGLLTGLGGGKSASSDDDDE